MKRLLLFMLFILSTVLGTAQIPNILPSYFESGNTFTYDKIVGSTQRVRNPRDLDFNPKTGDLWVINKGTENSGGSTVIISDPGESNQKSILKKDGNAWHFMSLPTGIAFSENGNFGTSTGVFDANHNGGLPFTGPSLWPGDLSIYGEPSGGNGSHIDMLHASPHCMGIASEKENVFWVMDAYSNDVVRYDFAEDHGPGNADHNDGVVRRYPDIFVSWINKEIPSHLVLDKNTNWLYIVDGGGKSVIRLDITSGTKGGTPFFTQYENLEEYTNVTGVKWETVTREGLEEPSGIDVLDGTLVVSDHKTGELVFYDVSGDMPAPEIGRLQTEEPGIQGIVIGPEGRIWYANHAKHKIVKIEPDNITSGAEDINNNEIKIYPNPTSGKIQIEKITDATIKLFNTSGQLMIQMNHVNDNTALDLEAYPNGVYIVEILSSDYSRVHKIIKE